MVKKILYAAVILLTANICLPVFGTPAEEGTLSVNPAELVKNIPLKGEWNFQWQQFCDPDAPIEAGTRLSVPGNWAADESFSAEGFGTYQLVLTGLSEGEIYALYVPEMISAFRLFINGREYASNGIPGKTRADTTPFFSPETVEFISNGKKDLLTIWVSNFDYRKSGVWRNLYLGHPDTIQDMRQKKMLLDMFLIGLLLFVSIYHVSLYLFRKKEKAQLYFGLICLVMAIRILSTGEQLLSYTLPGIPWEIARKMEFSPFFLVAALLPLFLQTLFPVETNRKIIRLILGISGLSAVIFLFLPVRISNHLIVIAELAVVINMIYCISIMIRAIKNRRIGSLMILLAMVILLLSITNDMLYSNQVIKTFYMTQIGFILFIVIQALMLSRRFAVSFKTIENLTTNLQEFNDSLSRFVPFQFLKYLQKASILEVNLGDQVHEEMTILFADIRSFTSLSEDMTPEENFRFLNSFLSNVVPVIREEGGFVDKFIGDGIMALFPESPDRALSAAIGLQNAVTRYNRNRDKAGYREIRLGIGLHSGSIMLGTIGEHDRMETTVISDTVNIASRMESLTKNFGASIIISRQTYTLLKHPERVDTRFLGAVEVKGKKKQMEVLEVLNSLPEPERSLKISSCGEFEKGVENYHKEEFEKCLTAMHTILSGNASDKAAAFFIEKCRDKMECSD